MSFRPEMRKMVHNYFNSENERARIEGAKRYNALLSAEHAYLSDSERVQRDRDRSAAEVAEMVAELKATFPQEARSTND
ncbi:hypothetical protein ACFSCV_07905 [Methylopila henanensis]|uniref:Uncharacterized protein n=2 Tax=Methylopila henanensis TaxID=873516 RepID=A0ABW4K7J8_9HYPH